MKLKPLVLSSLVMLAFACNNAAEAPVEATHEHDHSTMAAEENPDALYVPEGARVYFANLQDGQTVPTKFTVQFGLEGMEVKPAGEIVKGTGHHHIIIDGMGGEQGAVIPADETHIHFGGGQTETELELSPGEHTLTMQFANGIHQSYGPQMSATIKVIVK